MKNKYYFDEENVYITIPSKFGNFQAVIDKIDFELVNQYKTTWTLTYRNNKVESVQTKIQKNKVRKVIFLHRLIMGFPKDRVIDHIDRNPLNNKRNNLRVVTVNENATNLCENVNSITGYRNIHYESGKYRVRINHKRYGAFDTLEKAIEARNNVLPKIFPLRNMKGYI